VKIKNIGKVSRQWLYEVDIHTLEDLQKWGALATFRLIQARHPKVSLNLLWALEGAILNVDWRAIPADRKQALKQAIR
jgi:DNA transformation protein and related proteins